MAKRNDHHAPSTFDPAKYAYEGIVDLKPPMLPLEADECALAYYNEAFKQWQKDRDALRDRVNAGGFKGNFVEKATCDHCGAWFQYGAEYKHDDGEVIVVGNICADNAFGYDTRRAYDAARASKLHKGRKVRIAKFIAAAAFIKDHSIEHVFTAATMEHDSKGGRILDEMHDKLIEWGTISEKQIAFAKKLAEEITNPAPLVCGFCAAADHDHKTCPNRHPVPVTDARIEITGIVRHTEWRDNQYGGSALKAIVETVDGFKLWTTLPGAIQDAVDGYEYRGIGVRFMAKVERSDRDETFGFAKRPTKASVVDASTIVFNPRLPEPGDKTDAELRDALIAARKAL